jgi:hypothetical protein
MSHRRCGLRAAASAINLVAGRAELMSIRLRTRGSLGAVVLGAILALTFAGAPFAHADEETPYWRLDAGRLTVISNSSAQRCQRLAASVMRFEQVLFELAGWEPDLALAPLHFYSLDRGDSRTVLLTDAERQQKSNNIVIHSKWMPGAEFDIAAIVDIGGDEPLQSVLFMYGQGQLAQGPTRTYPAWYQLGVASLLNGVVIKPDGTVLLNRSLTFEAVVEKGPRPASRFDLAKLLEARPDTLSAPEFNEFVPQAREWAVFGLLTTPERRAQYHELALLMRQDASPEEAALEAFGKPFPDVAAEFDQGKWRKEVRFRLPPPTTPIAAPAATQIEPAQVESLLQAVAERVQSGM